MRRNDREITDMKTIESIVAGARFMHLGLFDDDYPYVVPMHYGYTLSDGKFTFYVHSAKTGQKLVCIERNNNVFVEIDVGERLIPSDIPCEYGAAYKSVMCKGKAFIINNAHEKCRALEIIMKTQTGKDFEIDERMADAVTVIKIVTDSITAKARLK